MNRTTTPTCLAAFCRNLWEEEREATTIQKYLRDVQLFAARTGEKMVTKELVSFWKDHLLKSNHQPVTVNGKLSALNKFFAFLGWNDCRVKYLKIQRWMFRSAEKELTQDDYTRLVETARDMGKGRLTLL